MPVAEGVVPVDLLKLNNKMFTRLLPHFRARAVIARHAIAIAWHVELLTVLVHVALHGG